MFTATSPHCLIACNAACSSHLSSPPGLRNTRLRPKLSTGVTTSSRIHKWETLFAKALIATILAQTTQSEHSKSEEYENTYSICRPCIYIYIYIQAYDIHTNLKTILKYRLYLSVSVHIYIYMYIYTGFYIYKMWDVRSHVWSTDSHLRSKSQTWSWMPRVSATWSNQNTECTPGWQLPSRDSPSHKMTSHHLEVMRSHRCFSFELPKREKSLHRRKNTCE